YGEAGLLDTLDNGEASDVELVGAGHDIDEAYTPHITEINGQSIALFGATDVMDEHLISDWTAGEDSPGMASTKHEMKDRMIEAVSETAEEVDNVVVYLHWGLEGAHCPLPHAPDLADELVAAGASAVVGGHAHVLSPGGHMDDAYVHYGLSNFVFYNFSGPTAETGELTLTFVQGAVVDSEWAPAQVQGGVPVPYEGDAAQEAQQVGVDMREDCGLPLTDSPVWSPARRVYRRPGRWVWVTTGGKKRPRRRRSPHNRWGGSVRSCGPRPRRGQDSGAPLTRRGNPSGLSSRSSRGSSDCGTDWKLTGLRKRRMAVLPTEVCKDAVVAG